MKLTVTLKEETSSIKYGTVEVEVPDGWSDEQIKDYLNDQADELAADVNVWEDEGNDDSTYEVEGWVARGTSKQ
jgi:hypothetical protein